MDTITQIAAFGAKTLLRQQDGLALAIGQQLGVNFYKSIEKCSTGIDLIAHLLGPLPPEKEEKLLHQILSNKTDKNYIFVLEGKNPVHVGEIIIPKKSNDFILIQLDFDEKYSEIMATNNIGDFPEIHLIDNIGNKKIILQLKELKKWKVWSQEAPSRVRINIALTN